MTFHEENGFRGTGTRSFAVSEIEESQPVSPLIGLSCRRPSVSSRRPSVEQYIAHGRNHQSRRKVSAANVGLESKLIRRFLSLEVEIKRSHNMLVQKLDTMLGQGSANASGNAMVDKKFSQLSEGSFLDDSDEGGPDNSDEDCRTSTFGDCVDFSASSSRRHSRIFSKRKSGSSEGPLLNIPCSDLDTFDGAGSLPVPAQKRRSRKLTTGSSHSVGSSQTSETVLGLGDDNIHLAVRRPSVTSSCFSDRIAMLAGRKPGQHTTDPPSARHSFCHSNASASAEIIVTEASVQEAKSVRRLSTRDEEDQEFEAVLFGARCSEEGIKRAKTLFIENRHSQVALNTWNFLDNPESSQCARVYASILTVVVFLTVVFSLMQTLEPPVVSTSTCRAMDVLIDAMFTVEIIVRYVVSPGRRVSFILEPFNIIDLVSTLALLIRMASLSPSFPELDKETFFVCAVAIFRLLKTTRRFQQIHLLKGAFQLAWEALPVLMFMLAVMTLVFSSAVYMVEPREKFDSLPRAIWFTMVTMTTVGYGDIVPETTEGTCIVFVLTIVSVLYMAVPLGIVGQAFKEVWADRDRILLVKKTQTALAQWGYTANDIPLVFSIFDHQGEGSLCLTDFSRMINQMRIGLSDERIKQLFLSFDKECTGYVDDKDFVRQVFPLAFNDLYVDAYEDADPHFGAAVTNQKCDCGNTLIPGGCYCGACGRRVAYSHSIITIGSSNEKPDIPSIGCRG